MAKLLHKAIGLGNGSAADPAAYAAYQQHFAEAPVAVLRDCLEFKSDRQPIDISEVCKAVDIENPVSQIGLSSAYQPDRSSCSHLHELAARMEGPAALRSW